MGHPEGDDLNTGEYRWRVPVGEVSALRAKGLAPTGTENYGGPVLKASGLIFIAASHDEMLRTFDQETGRTLWEFKLAAGSTTYSAAGKQFW